MSEQDIDLFVKFTRHSLFKDTWKEDEDPRDFEALLKGKPGVDWLRYPDGTDYHPVSDSSTSQKEDSYTNPPDEVWYFREFSSENRNHGSHYWWSDPRTWYIWEYSDVVGENGWFKPLITVPTPDELEGLMRITGWIEEHHPVSYIETWT